MLLAERPSRIPLKKKILFLLIVFAAGLSLAEVAARAVDVLTTISVEEHRTRYQSRRSQRLELAWLSQRCDYPYLPFLPSSTDHRVNTLGFRGEEIAAQKPRDTYRIFCLGGSTVWDEYPAFLQRALEGDFAQRGLKLEVVNAGNICWTSMESLINFITRCVPLGPDAIIVYQGINDAGPAFGDNRSWDYSHWRGRLEKNSPLYWDKLPQWLDRSAAYVGLRALLERKVNTVDFGQMTTKYRPNFEHDRYNGMEPLRQNLFTLVSVARTRGVDVFLCTLVFNSEYEFKWSLDRLAAATADANEIVRWFAGRWDDVHLIDVAASLKGSNDWMADFCHFTQEGKQKFVQFIAEKVRPHIPRLVDTRGDPMDVASRVPKKGPRFASKEGR